MERTGECKMCGDCCRVAGWFLIENKEETLEWLKAHIPSVEFRPAMFTDEYVNFKFEQPCAQLNEDNTCKLQDNKPEFCKKFPDCPQAILPGCGYTFER